LKSELMIRAATADDANALTTIAVESNRYWGYPEHWIKRWESDFTVSPEFIRENHVYVVEDEGEVRGFYALRVAGEKAKLEQLCVRARDFGSGVGKALFLDAMERAAALEQATAARMD